MSIGDALYEKVVSILPLDGVNAATVFPDDAGKTWTGRNGAIITTAQFKFGSSSLDCTGTKYIDTPDHADWAVADQDFCVEFWVRFQAAGSRNVVVGQSDSTGQPTSIPFMVEKSAANKIVFSQFNAAGATIAAVTGATTISAATWYHVACVRDGATNKIFLDGVQDGSAANGGGVAVDSANKMSIGRLGELNSLYANAHIDDFRLTVGDPRYGGNFTLPASANPLYYAQFTGSITESSAITDWRVSAYNAVTGELAATKTVNGASYSLDIKTSDPHIAAISPKVDGRWRPNTAVAVGFYGVATDVDATPHLWQCTTAGTTAATEPTWALSGTTADGSAVWTYVAPLVEPDAFGPKLPT